MSVPTIAGNFPETEIFSTKKPHFLQPQPQEYSNNLGWKAILHFASSFENEALLLEMYWAQSGSQHGKPLKTAFYNRNSCNRQSCCSNSNKYQHKFPVTFKMAKNEFKMLKTQVQKSQGECSSFSALPYCNPNTKEVLKDICFWATSYERDRKKHPNQIWNWFNWIFLY